MIDEVQKIPSLLDEVRWLIENRGISFLLTGSSARKLKRGHANLLGGRAWRRQMVPLTSQEVDRLDLESLLLSGLLPPPPHYLSPNPVEDLCTYFEILEDTYLGFRVPSWKKSKTRRMIEMEKFYLFDVGVTNYLARSKNAWWFLWRPNDVY